MAEPGVRVRGDQLGQRLRGHIARLRAGAAQKLHHLRHGACNKDIIAQAMTSHCRQ
jgi:hypothetical protein